MTGRRALKLAPWLLVLVLSACATSPDIPHSPPPDWMAGSPHREGMICAVGSSEPTFFVEDAKKYAAEAARRELARTIRTEIKSIMVDVATERWSNTDQASIMQTTASVTEAVVEHSEIVDYWYDSEGTLSFRRSVTYALGCMPRKHLGK